MEGEVDIFTQKECFLDLSFECITRANRVASPASHAMGGDAASAERARHEALMSYHAARALSTVLYNHPRHPCPPRWKISSLYRRMPST